MNFHGMNEDITGLAALLTNAGIKEGDLGIIPLHGGGNNRVFKIVCADHSYVLKAYAPHGPKKRNRLRAEYDFLMLAWKNGVTNVPKPVVCDERNNLALYGYIKDRNPVMHGVGRVETEAAVKFLNRMNTEQVRQAAIESSLGKASEACLTLNAHYDSVSRRIERLKALQPNDSVDSKAKAFVESTLIPEWEKKKQGLRGLTAGDNIRLRDQQIISPSDFGFHNAIITRQGQIYFIDFEYAGWDCPLKLVCDFFCQPEVPVPMGFLDYFTERVSEMVDTDHDIFDKVRLMMPLYRIKWCCIILNDFLPGDRQRRSYALSNKDRRVNQLKKASKYAKTYF